MGKYITVAEFAALQGISPQAVYKAIQQGKLNQVVKLVEKRKYIDIEAFNAAAIKPDIQPNNQPFNQVVKPVESEFSAIIEAKDQHIKTLEQQLQEAREQIKFLQQHIEQQAIIIDKQLHLQAHAQQLLEDPADGQTVAAPEPAAAPAAAPEREKPARGFFRRFLKK
jgi:hypothetical protein